MPSADSSDFEPNGFNGEQAKVGNSLYEQIEWNPGASPVSCLVTFLLCGLPP